MSDDLFTRLRKIHTEIPTEMSRDYSRMHKLLEEAHYLNPWLVPLEEAGRVLSEPAFLEYKKAKTAIEKLKQVVWDEVVHIFLEKKDVVEWYRHRPYPSCSCGDSFTRHYRAKIAQDYELQICWTNFPTDPVNTIDVRIRGIIKKPYTEKRVFEIFGFTVWTRTETRTYEEQFPDFGPTIAGPPGEGKFSQEFAEEAAKVPSPVRDFIFSLYTNLRERLG